jgi:cob(I)alamin adenosyltransferase
VCRRAERLIIETAEIQKVNPIIIKYLNRLSDFLFVMARKVLFDLKIPETPWIPTKNNSNK